MMTPNNIVHITGPVGRLEAIYLPAQGGERGVAVISHPNPLQGGTFTNKVIQTAGKALSQLGFHCYLPNYRGVGNSEGVYDRGAGEADDCVAVAGYARSVHPSAEKLVLAGFSFGGYVSLFAAERLRPDMLLLIGPAVKHYAVPEPLAPEPEKVLLIHGEIDEVIAVQKAYDWAAPQNIPVLVLPQSSHFFHGKLIPLRDAVLRFAPAVLPVDR